jgi:hypothetical protein
LPNSHRWLPIKTRRTNFAPLAAPNAHPTDWPGSVFGRQPRRIPRRLAAKMNIDE